MGQALLLADLVEVKSRKRARLARERLARQRRAMVIALAPVDVGEPIERIDEAQLELVVLAAAPALPAQAPEAQAWEEDAAWPGGLAPVITPTDAADAAMRAHLAEPASYGPTVTVVARVRLAGEARGRVVRLQGPVGAVKRYLPDTQTRAAWRAAGVEAPLNTPLQVEAR